MGYILPIHNEQYSQYANRTIPNKHQYQKIIKVMKPKMLGEWNESDTFFHVLRNNEPRLEKEMPKQKAYTKEKVEGMFAQLTGKGRLLNKKV